LTIKKMKSHLQIVLVVDAAALTGRPQNDEANIPELPNVQDASQWVQDSEEHCSRPRRLHHIGGLLQNANRRQQRCTAPLVGHVAAQLPYRKVRRRDDKVLRKRSRAERARSR
jgi:hypothetical protein